MSCVDNHISTQISIIYGSFLSRERLFWHRIDWLDISWWSIQTIGACVTPVTASNDSEGELRENWARCTKIRNWCRKVQKCVARKLFQLEQLHFVFWLSLSHCSHSWFIFSAGGEFMSSSAHLSLIPMLGGAAHPIWNWRGTCTTL